MNNENSINKSAKDEKKNGGIPLKKLNYIMSGITLVISVVLLISTYLTGESYSSVKDTTRNYISLEQVAQNLQIGSDILTEEVRAFAVTGKREHLDSYFHEANVDRHRDEALDVLKQHMENTPAYASLYYGMQKSLELMKREYYSMRLVIEANGYDLSEYPEEIQNVVLSTSDKALSAEEKAELAESMVFDEIYHQYKDDIRREMQKCIENLAERTDNNMTSSFNELQKLLILQQSLIIGLVVVILVVIILTTVQVIGPLVKAIPHIKEEQPLPVDSGAYEYRFLASTYNNMYEANKQSKKRLAYEATHDVMTGLYNRGGFEKHSADVNPKTAAIIIVDVDNFKTINDNYGHEKGDYALIKVAKELRKNFDSDDIICRFGGDEFVILMKEVEDNENTRKSLSDRILLLNDNVGYSSGSAPACSISAGIAFGKPDTDNFEVLLNEADGAMYEVKNNGKHGFAFGK